MRVLFRHSLLFLLLLTVFLPASGQVLPFHYYTIHDGLLSNSVNVVYQDSRGMLWIGTTDGISVYDGVSFRNYTTADGLSFSHVNDIIESASRPGTMLFATNGGGVNILHNNKFESIRFGESPWANRVNCLLEDHTGTLWCGADKGVFRILPSGTVEPFFPESNFININSIVETADSIIWMSTTEGLFYYSTGMHSPGLFEAASGGKKIYFKIFKNGPNDIWVPSADSLLTHIEGTSVTQRVRVLSGYPQSVIKQNDGVLWTGSGTGITKIEFPASGISAQRNYTSENGLQDNAIVAGLRDREGSLWFFSPNRGLARLSDHSVERFPHAFGSDYVNNQMAGQDRQGHFWIALGGYLCEFWNDGNSGWQHYHHSRRNSPLIETAASVQFDTSGNLWIRTYPSSFVGYRIAPHPGAHSQLTKLAAFDIRKDFPDAVPLCFLIDRRNHLWTTTNAEAVADYDIGSGKISYVYHTERGMTDLNVRALFQDSEGFVWFGEYIGGTTRVNPSTHESRIYTTADGLPENSVRAFSEDANKRVWIGMRYGGIAIFDHGSIKPLQQERNMLSKATACLANGSNGMMWAGTISGFMGIREPRNEVSVNENLKGERIYSCCVDTAGPIVLVTAEDLIVYNPNNDHPAAAPFPLYITGMSVNGQSRLTDGGLKFSATENNCTIQYNCINFSSSASVFYHTKLEPNDPDWQPATGQRAISYGSLKPGSYRFSVEALAPGGSVISSPAVLSFEITRPYWQTWWFILFVIVAIASLVYVAIQARIRRMVHIERIRSGIAADLHDDIGSGLIRIALLSEVIHRQLSPRATKAAAASDGQGILTSTENVGRIARELVDVMSDVVWSIDPKNEVLMKLLQRIEALAVEQCEPQGITMTFDVAGSLPSQKLGSQVLRCMLLITKEALANISKHSQCRNVTIRVRSLPEKRALSLMITDDGVGFDLKGLSRVNGLHNMRMRAESIGGSAVITSAKGEGTKVEAVIPL